MGAFVPAAGLGSVTVVSRSQGKLDAFVVGLDGRVWTAAWEPGDTAWRGWWQIDGVEAAPCAPVAAVCRSADKLDIFVVGLDGHIYTAAWEPTGDMKWRGWWRIGDLKTVLHAPISAVSRSKDKLDIFVSGLDGRVYTAAWAPTGDMKWRGWWQIGSAHVPPGAPVSAVCRSTDKLDIFVVGSDGKAYTAAWQTGDKGWRGWWNIPGFDTVPRTPIAAVSRSKDKLDIFAVGLNGGVYTAAWEPVGDQKWRGWWRVGNFESHARTPVTAVSRSADKLDIFAVGFDGKVYTAAWAPVGDQKWRGWWAVRDLVTAPRTTVGAVCRNTDMLDVTAPRLDDARVLTAAWAKGDKEWRGWWFVAHGLTGMTDPQVGAWAKAGVAFSSENTAHSEEAQGMTTDGTAWFLTSNGTKSVRKYGDGATLLAQTAVGGGHVGAGGCYEGWLYIAIQGPHGFWKATTGLASPQFVPADKGDGRFPWCDVNPLNGRLYTSEFDHWNNANGILFAYDRDTGARCPEDDIALGPTPIHFDRIQGGVFTRRGRVIISRSDPNGIFCFSAVTGHCFGGKHLGDFGSSYSEVEGVTVRGWNFGGTEAPVHVLELDNDGTSKDDCYLHSFWVPEPERL